MAIPRGPWPRQTVLRGASVEGSEEAGPLGILMSGLRRWAGRFPRRHLAGNSRARCYRFVSRMQSRRGEPGEWGTRPPDGLVDAQDGAGCHTARAAQFARTTMTVGSNTRSQGPSSFSKGWPSRTQYS
ncbi:MAG: hypothetical protein K0S70_5068 [Microbacterium sp.]|nr:hypothetical protein [Microbacterium sp.]